MKMESRESGVRIGDGEAFHPPTDSWILNPEFFFLTVPQEENERNDY
jgi:hypothetical protein